MRTRSNQTETTEGRARPPDSLPPVERAPDAEDAGSAAADAAHAEDAGGAPPDVGVDPPEDAGAPGSLTPVIAHLPDEQSYYGLADLVLESTTIDTSVPEIENVPLPSGITFELSAQTEPGPIVAVLHVAAFEVVAGSVVRIIGDHPLIVAAGGDITIAGIIDASADHQIPGAGGYAPGEGPAAGADGPTPVDGVDLGAGGGAFGTNGGSGGLTMWPMFFAGGVGGTAIDDPDLFVLQGGSGGGAGSKGDCLLAAPGGAGGGAIQLHSAASLVLAPGAVIAAHGGGGCGGTYCFQADAGGGAGGGAGGAIYLEASSVVLMGTLANNGGAGGGAGSGASTRGVPPGPGGDGEDGTLGGAQGGAAGGIRATDGGDGSNTLAGEDGQTLFENGNSGGGGGGRGRTVIRTH